MKYEKKNVKSIKKLITQLRVMGHPRSSKSIEVGRKKKKELSF